MSFLKIWQRYFVKEVFKTASLFLICFFGLYVLIDYATHASSFHRGGSFSWNMIIFYYLLEFVRHLEILLPFALVLATVKTLTGLNTHNELVALMASGVRLKTLLRPFIFLAITATLLLYLNTQIFVPQAMRQLKHLNEARSLTKDRNRDIQRVNSLVLEDGSTVLYQRYDSTQKTFFDAYWIRSLNEIYRIKILSPYSTVPTGHFVDVLARDDQGNLVVSASHKEQAFPGMKFNKQTLFESMTLPEEQSYTDLWNKIPSLDIIKSEKQAQLVTSFYFKLAMPWLSVLAVLAVAPFCVRFSRHQPLFYIYAFSIFGIIAFQIVMDSAMVLGERQVIIPHLAIWLPFFAIASFFGYRYARITT